MKNPFDQIKTKLTKTLWLTDLTSLPYWESALVQSIRILFAIIRDLSRGELTLRAMSLVYTTLLSLVPLLAVSFSVLKAFGVHNQIEPILLNLLTPLGEKGIEITSNIISFVERMKVGILGTLGVALLLYTVIALMQKIETAFNYTWRITQSRRLQQRFSDYLSVLLIGPVLVFSAVGLTGTMMNNATFQWLAHFEVFGQLIAFLTRLIPYLLIICAFAFIYIFMPNTRVKIRSAFIGALVAGILWESVGWAFASFVVSTGRYTAVYSAFASLILFLIWLYLGWLILLIGASIAFYHQNPDYVATPLREPRLSNRMKEELALRVMVAIAQRYYHGLEPLTAKELALLQHFPSDIMCRLLDALECQGLIKQTGDKIPTYLPARPLEEMSVKQVIDAVRAADEDKHLNPELLRAAPKIKLIFEQLDEILEQQLGSKTIKDLIQQDTQLLGSHSTDRQPVP